MLLGWRDVPRRQLRTSASRSRSIEPVIRQVFIGRGAGRHRDRRAGAQALHHPQELRATRSRRCKLEHGKEFYVPSMSARTVVYKGMLLADQVGHVLPGPAGRARGVGAGAGAPALLDQHLPDVGPGAPVPHDRAQRRDQHRARQRQLDPRAPGRDLQPDARRGPRQALAADLRRPVRLGIVRQRARTAGDGRLLDRARDDDDDPRGLGKPHADGSPTGARSTNTTRR